MLTSSDSKERRAVICQAGSSLFALSSRDVREVCTDAKLVQMPGVAPPVEGVINLRGTLVTIVRASSLLGGRGEPDAPSTWFVVLRYRDGRVGLGVDDVVDFALPSPDVPWLDPTVGLEPHFRRA
ncbi:MAG: chemotaxis protein CheW [Gemmatimonadales bacterium]